MKKLVALLLSLFLLTSNANAQTHNVFVAADRLVSPPQSPRVIKIDSNLNMTDFTFTGANGVEFITYEPITQKVYGFYPETPGVSNRFIDQWDISGNLLSETYTNITDVVGDAKFIGQKLIGFSGAQGLTQVLFSYNVSQGTGIAKKYNLPAGTLIICMCKINNTFYFFDYFGNVYWYTFPSPNNSPFVNYINWAEQALSVSYDGLKVWVVGNQGVFTLNMTGADPTLWTLDTTYGGEIEHFPNYGNTDLSHNFILNSGFEVGAFREWVFTGNISWNGQSTTLADAKPLIFNGGTLLIPRRVSIDFPNIRDHLEVHPWPTSINEFNRMADIPIERRILSMTFN